MKPRINASRPRDGDAVLKGVRRTHRRMALA
jgi:hypothetical protein